MSTSRRSRRLVDLLVALLILAMGIGSVVVATEYAREASAKAPLLTLDDITIALRGRIPDVAVTGEMVGVPGLDRPGHVVQVNDDTITVVVFDSVPDRVSAEQGLIAKDWIFTADHGNLSELPSLLSASNVLILHDVSDGLLVQTISASITQLASSAR